MNRRRLTAAATAGFFVFALPAPAQAAAPFAALAAPSAALGAPSAALGAPSAALAAPSAALAAPSLAAFVPSYAEPAPLAGDSVRDDEWHLETLDVADAWTFADGAGVTVAVIDSGVDADHPDLAGQVLAGTDLVTGKGNGDTDLVGHGTTVSAIIAGRNDDDRGVVGIAPKAKILPVRVLDEENRYDDAIIVARGVRWAVDHGARVINLSLGGNGSSAALAAALDYAFAKDVVVVACTGNQSTSPASEVWYPAREPGVLAVAGMERDGTTLWSGSITGSPTVITAPATQLVGAQSGGGYWKVQGTSFAAPMVSATAALIRSRWPTMPAGEVINRIIRTASDRGAAGRDAMFGFGVVNPTAALTASVPPVLDNPLDTNPSPGIARFGSAPAPGQAQWAPPGPPESSAPLPAAAQPGGGAAPEAMAVPQDRRRGWWAAAGLFLMSVVAAAVTVRRFAHAA